MPMDWTKSPPELVALFDEVAPTAPAVERRKMFGYPAAFVNGNMFAGLHGANMVLRLPEAPLREFLALDGAKPFEPMPGRAMKGYAVAPPALLANKPALSGWLERSFEGAAAMPPKEKKPKAAKKK
ncbi:MAG TPA: TfoX/Sxy family protein [Chloroflexota bacterium]|jgi:TfoX/Sxy family transcriptional regulator of competence genes